jgi:hypothetical protein
MSDDMSKMIESAHQYVAEHGKLLNPQERASLFWGVVCRQILDLRDEREASAESLDAKP